MFLFPVLISPQVGSRGQLMLESVFSQPLLCFHCKSYEFSLHLIVNLCIGNVCISKLQRITLSFKKEYLQYCTNLSLWKFVILYVYCKWTLLLTCQGFLWVIITSVFQIINIFVFQIIYTFSSWICSVKCRYDRSKMKQKQKRYLELQGIETKDV